MNMSSGLKNNKEKEEILRLESYIRDFWEFLPIPVCYINPGHIILDVDKVFIDFSGYKTSEIIGEELNKLFAEPEKIEEFKKEILNKGIISNKELVFLTKDKREIPVSVSAMQRKDEKSNIVGYFLSIIDISESKKFREKLEKEIEKKTLDLKQKIDELEKINKIMMGRELKMIELKKKIAKLESQLKELKKSDF